VDIQFMDYRQKKNKKNKKQENKNVTSDLKKNNNKNGQKVIAVDVSQILTSSSTQDQKIHDDDTMTRDENEKKNINTNKRPNPKSKKEKISQNNLFYGLTFFFKP